MSTSVHTLVVTDDYGDGNLRYRIECHGVTDRCRTWVECDCSQARPSDEWDGDTWFDWASEEVAHGVLHADIDGAWSRPTDDCWLRSSVNDLPDSFDETLAGLRPGRYVVDHEYVCGGEGAFTLTLVGAVVTS